MGGPLKAAEFNLIIKAGKTEKQYWQDLWRELSWFLWRGLWIEGLSKIYLDY